MADAVQLDDQLVNGYTYTYQFQLVNHLFSPTTAVVLRDVQQQAPDFLTSVAVTMQEGLTALFYNVQFTYEGDGSDVVSDVAASLVAAFKAGSNDNFEFLGASTGAAPGVPGGQAVPTVQQAVTSVGAGAVATAGDLAKGAASQAGGVVNTALTGLLPLLAVVVLVILFVLPSLAKSARSAGVAA